MDNTRHHNATQGSIHFMHNENQQKVASFLLLLDKMRKNYTPLIWWSSFVASKDRFYSESQHQFFSKAKNPETRHYYHIIKFPLYLFFEWWKIVQTKYYFKKTLPNKNATIQIIKSFAYEHSLKNEQFIDPMFNNLQEKLQHISGIKTITIYSPLGNIKTIIGLGNQNNQEIYPLHLFSKSADVFKIIVTILKNVISLLATQTQSYSRLEQKIHKELILAQFSYMNIQGLLHYFTIKNIINRYTIKKFIYTYENNIWEKFTLLQLRKSSPETKIIGHLHSVVPESALNFFVSAEEDMMAPLPDKIVTPGQEPAAILNEYGCYTKTIIQVGSSLKFAKVFSNIKKIKEVKKHLLIGMEGIPQSIEMINYALSQMEQLPDWNITLRTHPILPLDSIYDKLIFSKELEKRLEFSSNKPLNQDLDQSGAMIYWGSTLCFEAIMYGVPLINYQTEHQLSFDPLFKMDTFKHIVNKDSSLILVLNKLLKTPISVLEKEQEIACLYVNNYFSSVTDEQLKINYVDL